MTDEIGNFSVSFFLYEIWVYYIDYRMSNEIETGYFFCF